MIEYLDEFVSRVEMLAKKCMFNQALTQIVDFAKGISDLDGSIARVFSSPDLDRLCLHIGRECRPQMPERHDDDHTIFIATQLYRAGGHTRVLGDLIQADVGTRHTLLITDTMGKS